MLPYCNHVSLLAEYCVQVVATKEKKMEVSMNQHPVGQGGLFTGCLTFCDKKFRWVYDCGTDHRRHSKAALVREINGISNIGDIDVLFLSHLDSDHVSGVDDLSRKCQRNGHKIREVVIPYMSDTALIFSMARDEANGRLTQRYISVVSNFYGFLGDLGAERVIITQSSDPEGDIRRDDRPRRRPSDLPRSSEPERDPDDSPRGSDPERDSGGLTFLARGSDGHLLHLRQVEELEKDGITPFWCFKEDPKLLVRRGVGSATQIIDVVSDLNLIFSCWNDCMLNFTLASHAHRPSTRLLRRFENQLSIEFKGLPKSEISKQALIPAGRAKLLKCYGMIWKNHNLVSMSLYCGPFVSKGSFCLSAKQVRYNCNRGGWLLTGDSKLSVVRRRKKFIERYKKYMPKTCTFMAPHHGSSGYFGFGLLRPMKNLKVCYAAAESHHYGHPGPAVINAVSHHGGAFFHKVDTSILSILNLWMRLNVVLLRLKNLRRYL